MALGNSLTAAALAALVATSLSAQGNYQRAEAPPRRERREGPADGGRPIQDNSFLIEEAYNQERGVVQHISGFSYDVRSQSFSYLFTQEWPIQGVRTQLSYSVSMLHDGIGTGVGLGDSRLNFRYQLVGDGDAALAIAPRLTAVLPTGNYAKGRGVGSPGVEAAVPFSLALSNHFVAHANVGLTIVPNALGFSTFRATTHTWTSGASVVWLAWQKFNVLLEGVVLSAEEVSGPGAVVRGTRTTVSPGIRWAYDFPSGLQIVPGLAVPLSSTAGVRTTELFLYLSLEHPFSRSP